MKPMDRMLRSILAATAVIVAICLTGTALLAQGALDADLQAAEQGDAEVRFNLGVMYANGDGVPEDDAEAVRWYRLAAEQGHARAQGNLGSMYANGEGVIKDAVMAHMWFNFAGANGIEAAREVRDDLEGDMTPAERANATELARICMSSSYRDCGP